MEGSVSNYCQESGEWAHPVPLCGGPCTIPSPPRDGGWTYGNRPGTSVDHKTRLGVRCNWRFTEKHGSLECNDGEWSDSDDVHRLCEGTPCRVRSSIGLNIAYTPPVPEEDRLRNRVQHDTRVRYTCARGYYVNGEEETRCVHGSYEGSLTTPRCELVRCPAEEIAHGKFIYNSSSGGDDPNPLHWDTRQLECKRGYQLLNSGSGQCDNGVWINSGTGPLECYPMPCKPIPETNMRSVHYTTPRQDGKYHNGTRVDVNCESGYVPAIDNGTALCHASRWWKAIPTCTQSLNRAIGSTTSQKETNRDLVVGNSWHAIDGNTESKPQYCSRISRMKNPWWKAVMTSIYNVTDIKIYNRLNKHKIDLDGAEIRVGMDEDYTANLLCGEPITQQQINASIEDRHGIAIKCRRQGILGIIGQVISVHIPAEEKRELSLCEVEVYVQGGPISVNGAEEGGQVGCVVPHVENANLASTEVAKQQVLLAGQDVRFSCKPGYDLVGAAINHVGEPINHVDLVCLSTSSWNQVTPVCNPQTCTVRLLYHGNFPDEKILYNHGENILFSCDNGYEKQSNSTYWCDRSSARPSIPACVPASCDAPALPDYTLSSQPRYGHDTLLRVSCEVGFQLSANQENNRPRCRYGSWTRAVDVTCERVPCPEPGRGTQSTVEVLPGVVGYVHGARIRYNCGEGWEIEGVAERDCNNGQWTGSQPECRVAAPPRCMLPERSNGEIFSITGYTGRIFDEGLPIGEHVTISVRCNPGFTPQSYVRTGCSDIGQWLVPVPICVRRERLCAKPGYISHVVQYVNGVDTNELSSYPHNELPEGTFLVSRCSLPGTYELRGSANRTCVEGRWSGEEPRCDNAGTEIYFRNNQPMEIRSNGTIVIYPQSLLRIFCRMPYGSNAIAHLTSDNGPVSVYWSDHYGLSVMIPMNPPRAWHSGRYTCQSRDGAMSHSVFIQVAAIDCEQPRAPQNGAVLDNDFGWKYQRYPIGKQVVFTCNRGYSRGGASRSKCVFGEWSHPVPRCIRATCPELQPPSHGTKIGGNTVGHSVIIVCNQGYQLQGESFLDCLESGNWSYPLPTCIAPCRVRSSIGLNIAYTPPVPEEDRLRNRVPHDTGVRYTCARGYYVNGVEETRCVHGSYEGSPTTPRCELVPCPVEEIAHGKFIYNSSSGGDDPNPVHWDARQLECNRGYQPLNSRSGQCDNGVWINNGTGPLECYPKETRSLHPSCNPDLTFIEEPEDLERTEGAFVEPRCRVSDEDAIISWFKDGQRLNPGLNEEGIIVTQDNGLFITNFDSEHQGLYACVVLAGDTECLRAEANITLNPFGFFRIVPEDATIDTDVVNFHIFNCTPQDDRWSISWEKDGEPIENPTTMSGNLLLRNILEEDEGKYTCVVRHPLGSTKGRADAWLFLSEPPQLDISTTCGTITFWRDTDQPIPSPEEEAANEAEVDMASSLDWSSADVNQAEGTGKIVGGDIAKNGSAPFMVRIIEFRSRELIHQCGATLLDQSWVLTAAHCMFKKGTRIPIPKAKMTLVFGEYDTLKEEESEKRRGLAEIIVHDEYNHTTYDNDIALIRIEPPLREFTPYIRPICLAPSGLSRRLMQSAALGRVNGWGRQSEKGPTSRVLKEVEVPFVDRQTCRESIVGDANVFTASMFCAGYHTAGKDSCSGDSGGPLAVRHDDGRWYQLGIVSWGIGCARRGEYGFYTRVSRFLDWIRSKEATVAYSPNVGTRFNESLSNDVLAFAMRSPSDMTVAEGSKVDLECVPNRSDASVQWFIRNTPVNSLQGGVRILPSGLVFHFDAIEELYSGSYSCEARVNDEYGEQTIRASFQLEVTPA